MEDKVNGLNRTKEFLPAMTQKKKVREGGGICS